ncbi:MAG: ATP-binding cassette domain-containing protein [Rikenellaceae bacterium]
MIIEVKDVVKQYAFHRALDGVNLSVPRGSIYGLLGPNGAGKSTLMRIVNRITMPDSGTLKFDGREMTQKDVARIGYLPEERGLYKKMKVGEQALYLSRLKGMSRSDAYASLRRWFEKFEILGWWDKKVEELSKGMAQKIQFIITVIHNPELLIFDEPFSGFDPVNAEILKNEMLERAKAGATIIFSTHNMESVEQVCEYITLINRSKDVLSGRVEDVRNSYGNNTYTLGFSGENETLISAIGAMGQCTEVGRGEIEVRLAQFEGARELIEVANRSVELVSVNRKIPSMNEIFISVVGKN